MFELTAKTETGARLVALAETLAEDLASRAGAHDREATYPHAGIAALKRAGYFAAAIPAEYGGLGVTSVHDVLVASSRLARGDASVAIGVNMHLVRAEHRPPLAGGRGRRRRAAGAPSARSRRLRETASSMAAATASAAKDLTRPQTTARRGRPRAGASTAARRSARCRRRPTVLVTAVTYVDDHGAERDGASPTSSSAGRASTSSATGTPSACARRAATRSGSTACERRGRALRGGFATGWTRPRSWTAT